MNHIAQTTFNRANLALLAAVLVAGGAVLFAEGCAGTISLSFALFAVVMTAAAGYSPSSSASSSSSSHDPSPLRPHSRAG